MNIYRYGVGFIVVLVTVCSVAYAQSIVAPQLSPIEISGSVATQLYSDGVFITWDNNRPERFVLDYGVTSDYGTRVNSLLILIRHEAILQGLQSATTYHFRITLQDDYNQSLSKDFTFTTLPAGQPSLPKIGLERFLQYGNRGEDVLRLQEFLRSEGLYDGASTGFYNQGTVLAVKQFQCAQNIVCGEGKRGYGEVLRNTFHEINRRLGV